MYEFSLHIHFKFEKVNGRIRTSNYYFHKIKSARFSELYGCIYLEVMYVVN